MDIYVMITKDAKTSHHPTIAVIVLKLGPTRRVDLGPD
jgi:hypothetical protein